LRGHSDDPRLPKEYPDPPDYKYLDVPYVQLAKGECGNPARLMSKPAIINAMMNGANSGVVCVRVHEDDDVMGSARQFNQTDQPKFREEKMETHNATVKEVHAARGACAHTSVELCLFSFDVAYVCRWLTAV